MSGKLFVIAGPTASGKSRWAIELAQKYNAEIISADSQQVYKYFDIGTAKPSLEDQKAVRHHLISIVEPAETFSAAQFQKRADAAIADIRSRGKQVIVVGGTGLYLRILLRGVVAAPSADSALRATLAEDIAKNGIQSLHQRLHQVDPETASSVEPTDQVRIVRALEIFMLSGQTASSLRTEHQFKEARYPFCFYVLKPDREKLYAAINQRTRQMFAAGLIEETTTLIDKGFRDCAPMRSVGYSQALQVIDGRWTREQAEEDVAQKTRHYAKRQVTWFNKEPVTRFIETDPLLLPLVDGEIVAALGA